MTISAGDISVSAFQQKIGLRVVIEQPEIPCNRVMAGVAGILEPVVVVIIFEMAGDTVFFGINEDLGFMTAFAFDIVVLTQKREFGQVMIEARHIIPGCLSVTIAAVFSLRPLVYVVVEMA